MDSQIDAPENARLGYGIDPSTGQLKSPALDGTLKGEEQQFAAGQYYANCRYVDTYQELSEVFGFDSSVSYSWMSGSASAKVSVLNTSKTSSHTLTACFYARVTVPPILLQENPKLSKDAAALLGKNQPSFFDSYGSHFIDGFVRGGEFFAVLTLEVSDSEEKKSLKASVNVEAWGGNASAALATDMQSKLSKYDVKLFVSKTGSELKEIPFSFAQLLNDWIAFPKDVGAKPGILQVILRPYSDIYTKVKLDQLILDARAIQVKTLAAYFGTFKEFINELDAAIANPEQFSPLVDVPTLVAMRKQCSDGIQSIVTYSGQLRKLQKPQDDITAMRPDDKLRVQIVHIFGRLVTVRAVDATPTDTGIDVAVGDRIDFWVPPPGPGIPQRWTVSASAWGDTDANGYPTIKDPGAVPGMLYPQFRFGRLIAFIGDDKNPFDVGLEATIIANKAGRILLLCNDNSNHPVGYKDNSGEIAVRIRLP